MKKKRIYHKNKCENRVRVSAKDKLGRTIVLTGRHAFEWNVTIINFCGTTTTEFKNRTAAYREFNRYTK